MFLKGKQLLREEHCILGTSDIADCNYELDMFNEIQSAQAKVVTLNKDADVKRQWICVRRKCGEYRN